MPFFSIIIPVYNVAPYLRECLDSVLAQIFTDWEAVCIDDGSTDGGGTILDEYAAGDVRFKVIHQKNSGVSAARNVALDIATGEWVCFVDADDIINIDWLVNVAKGIAHNPSASWIAAGHTAWFSDERPVKKIVYAPQLTRCVRLSDARNEVWRYAGAAGILAVHFFKKAAVGDKRFNTKIKIKEDTLFVLSVALGMEEGEFVELPIDGYLYRQYNNSASRHGAGTDSVCAFQDELNRLWLKFPSERKYFTLLAYKNVNLWLNKGEHPQRRDIEMVRSALKKACSIGALSIFTLPMIAAIKLWSLVHLGFWRSR